MKRQAPRISLGFTLKYTLLITPVLMIGGYLLALLVAGNTPLRRFTRAVIFIPVVIGLGASSLLWYWLFSTNYGLVNRLLQEIGLIAKPVFWLGVDADLSNWAIIASVTWKVIGCLRYAFTWRPFCTAGVHFGPFLITLMASSSIP